MLGTRRFFLVLLCILTIPTYANPTAVPILCYHRFADSVLDNMTITTNTFIEQMDYLVSSGYQVVSLDDAVEWHKGAKTLPDKSVVITLDDGHISQWTTFKPLIERYKFPVTLFIYPSAISNASYAMTWDKLREFKQVPGVSIQGHTFWHPNFNVEKKRLSPEKYTEFVNTQLRKSKSVLETKLGISIHYLAWPFGIENTELRDFAQQAGYTHALALEGRSVRPVDSAYALPRYLIGEQHKGKAFSGILKQAGATP